MKIVGDINRGANDNGSDRLENILIFELCVFRTRTHLFGD